jgi:hypothetical protein
MLEPQAAIETSGTRVIAYGEPSKAQRALDGMIRDFQRFLITKHKPERHFTSQWEEGVIPISSSLRNDRQSSLDERQAIETVCRQNGEDFKFENHKPVSSETVSEFLERNGKTGVDLENNRYYKELGVKVELKPNKTVGTVTVYHVLPKAPKVNTPEGHTWQLARAENFIPYNNSINTWLK